MIARANVVIIHAPWADYPVAAELPFASVHADITDGAQRTSPAALSAAELLGIDPAWPPDEPFPKA